MERIKFKEILTLHNLFMGLYGVDGLAVKCTFQLESVRETLMKLRVIWADNELNLRIAMDTVHILTVIQCMAFKYQMDGGRTTDDSVFCQSVWVEPDRVCSIPALTAPQGMKSKLKACLNYKPELYTMTLNEIIGSRKECKVLAGLVEADPFLDQVAFRFNAAQVLLDDAEVALKSVILEDEAASDAD